MFFIHMQSKMSDYTEIINEFEKKYHNNGKVFSEIDEEDSNVNIKINSNKILNKYFIY